MWRNSRSSVWRIMKALLTFLFVTHILVSSHPDPSSTSKPLKVPYPYKMHSLGHDADTGIKNTYQGESYGNIYIINHPGYGNDIVIHNYPAGAKWGSWSKVLKVTFLSSYNLVSMEMKWLENSEQKCKSTF